MTQPPPAAPKLFTHKPKKSQRTTNPPASQAAKASLPKESSSTSSVIDSGKTSGGGRTSSLSPGSAPPPGGGQQPLWYRFRTAITTLFVVNALVIGYSFLRTTTKPVTPEDVQTTKDEAAQEVDRDGKAEGAKQENQSITTEGRHEANLVRQAALSQETHQPRPQLSRDQEQNLFEWMLTEKRKIKPANKMEEAQMEKEKALLKHFLRERKSLIS